MGVIIMRHELQTVGGEIRPYRANAGRKRRHAALSSLLMAGLFFACGFITGFMNGGAGADSGMPDGGRGHAETLIALKNTATPEDIYGDDGANWGAEPPAVRGDDGFDAPDADRDAWYLRLVNRDNPLPDDYIPELAEVGGQRFDARAADALKEMLAAGESEGLSFVVCSAYRTVERQATLYENKVRHYTDSGFSREEAERLAGSVVAYPGTSEHNLGLAADIVALDYQLLDEGQEQTPEFQWLHANCHRYGFILRYPPDRQDITGIIYEPWHFRYAGTDAAAEIMERGICLEEYLQ